MSDRELLVYVDLAGEAHFAGRLWARRVRNRESLGAGPSGSALHRQIPASR